MKNKLKLEIKSILDDLNYPKIDVNVQIPKKIDHGHLTTNIAMIIAKQLKITNSEAKLYIDN